MKHPTERYDGTEKKVVSPLYIPYSYEFFACTYNFRTFYLLYFASSVFAISGKCCIRNVFNFAILSFGCGIFTGCLDK